MQWLQLMVSATRESSGAIEDALLDCGAVSVSLEDAADQPILEPGVGETPLWDNCQIKALFDANTDTTEITEQLQNMISGLSAVQWEQLEDKDWSQEWKKYFSPLKCGDRLWICPSWIAPPDPDAINLSLDPGLAFGTGSHPTTHLCLRWLDKQDLAGQTVIDYGCGSGILGIAALLLGAERVIAVDNDPQALLATRDNAQRNNIAAERLETYLPDQVPANSVGQTMLANILAAPLITLAPTLTAMTAANGNLCLSGLLEHQIDAVCAPYRDDFSFADAAIESEWAQLSARKNA
ncbi:MAG: 50S ribosomal protein L11 methyltransferase [Porticoccaceae bacterium]|jgi:ribosomal protein L11 methyltransferase|nr:MAG: ribosomal protein L11 methyltransferase [SAR92 bacterium BACL16 MAG-120619-bin48]KRP26934.1 MAG: ribosomal protein L11 methyltransferase [SAR92 bacterium BACL16 MAG-120322-bin99]MDP4653607.1 50S ribosomal protein L11 methyltransferase [Alphaproteobacteria bacterium]MDP4743902.1 50S ribosomal protein L11 methyltransferase [Porticoccaceae bacterium]MDP4752467.1 50S ribosomal protein L11 methyltransferase [Porticoccaceae bacterium]